jgi:tetratricopeptide (TPR) repeat protein
MYPNDSEGAITSLAGLLLHAPKPRPRPPGIDWDVFISYRSVNRAWALALHDALQEAGFTIFLDQYVLRAGDRLDKTLEQQLRRSMSGVLVWTAAASESDWVDAEYKKMRDLKKERSTFHFVIAKLDAHSLPFLEHDTLYVDFTQYPEGPRGGELLRLLFGLVGQPLSGPAVKAIQDLDEDTTEVLRRLNAARDRGDASTIVEVVLQDAPALHATPVALSVAADSLIAMKEYDEALRILAIARARFAKSIRPRQLEGLALRRKAAIAADPTERLALVQAALEVFSLLHADGHRDPETLGMYAATWTVRYRLEGRRLHLERAQELYEEAFRLTPSDYYVGINAASKLALLGFLEPARKLASSVLEYVTDSVDGADYWKTATHAEARLLLGDFAEAARLYRKAVARHSEERGSIDTTRTEMEALLGSLAVPENERIGLRQAFE